MKAYAKEFAEVNKELKRAIKEHPWFTGSIDNSDAYLISLILASIRATNESESNTTAKSIALEELFEAVQAACDGDMDHAYNEFAQLAAVAIRSMILCKELKEQQKHPLHVN